MNDDINNPYETPQSEISDATQDEYGEVRIFSFKGRIGRIRYLGYSIGTSMLIQTAVSILLGIFFAWYGPKQDLLVTVVVPLLIATPIALIFTMLTIQRLHDVNWTGWFSLLILVPGVNVILGLILSSIPGTDGGNRFGLKPPPNTLGTYIVALIAPLLIIGILAAIAIPAYNDFSRRGESQSLSR
jgi:uncharacterized membrane protein YhaH (DUF805 family)